MAVLKPLEIKVHLFFRFNALQAHALGVSGWLRG
jgi:hypothetical protein